MKLVSVKGKLKVIRDSDKIKYDELLYEDKSTANCYKFTNIYLSGDRFSEYPDFHSRYVLCDHCYEIIDTRKFNGVHSEDVECPSCKIGTPVNETSDFLVEIIQLLNIKEYYTNKSVITGLEESRGTVTIEFIDNRVPLIKGYTDITEKCIKFKYNSLNELCIKICNLIDEVNSLPMYPLK